MQIFSYKGIPIRLHSSFLLLAGIWIVYSWINIGHTEAIITTALGAFLFGSVLLHELGHAAMARAFGISTRHITLYPFGGIAAIEREPKAGSQEFFIAVAGPVVNFVLAGVLMPLSYLGVQIVPQLILINVAMGIFNLIPAYPMDGGRVLRSWLSGSMGKTKATKVAINVSYVFAFIFLCVGMILNWIGLTFVGVFLWYAISQEKRRLLA